MATTTPATIPSAGGSSSSIPRFSLWSLLGYQNASAGTRDAGGIEAGHRSSLPTLNSTSSLGSTSSPATNNMPLSQSTSPLVPHAASIASSPAATTVGAAAAALSSTSPIPGRPPPPPIAPTRVHTHTKQTTLTKLLLTYIRIFRIANPIVSLTAFATILPVLIYFRTQQIFPAVQATLYIYTATLAGCSLFFSAIYLLDVIKGKHLCWPLTSKHFRQTSKARIGGDMIICIIFCIAWFLALVGLIIDTAWVDCGNISGFEPTFVNAKGQIVEETVQKVKRICQLEKASMALAVFSWTCWMGVLAVLTYGHFWKRRAILAERLRKKLLGRGKTTTAASGQSTGVQDGTNTAVVSRALGSTASTTAAGTGTGTGSSAAAATSAGPSGYLNVGTDRSNERRHPSDCTDQDGEVGFGGIIYHYDDESRGNTVNSVPAPKPPPK